MIDTIIGKPKVSATELRVIEFKRISPAITNSTSVGWKLVFNSPNVYFGSNDITIHSTNSDLVSKNMSQVGGIFTVWISGINNAGEFYITIDPTNISDPTLGALLGGAVDSPTVIVDKTAPTIVSIAPPTGTTNVPLNGQTFTLTMSENIKWGTGSVRIRRVSDGTILITYNSTTVGAVINGNTITFALGEFLKVFTEYFFEIDSLALLDLAGNDAGAISGVSTMRFKTVIGSPELQVANITGSQTKTTVNLTVTKPTGTRIIVLGKANGLATDYTTALSGAGFASVLGTANDYEAVDDLIYTNAGSAFNVSGYKVVYAGGAEAAITQTMTVSQLTGTTNYRFYAYTYYKDETGCYYNTAIAPFTKVFRTNAF